ncbi:hydrolase RBBP9 [Acrasis kona]|uniref:Hydrolase RBBP9 n=1 Tax=Acrasis kona TaxID=1008807 RepID=A0AAW2YZK1_9EUKA
MNKLLSKASNIIILPGNGCTPIMKCNWYAWLKAQLEKEGLKVDMEKYSMPDPHEAKESIWLPHVREKLNLTSKSLLIGHSSGAVAIMRLAETDPVLGIVIVSGCHTDLGMESEAISGYYARPWKWNHIKKNAEHIIQLHSKDDPFIPIDEARHISSNLNSDYHEYDDQGHFMEDTCPILLDILKNE